MALCTYVPKTLIPKHYVMLSTYMVDFASAPVNDSKIIFT